MTSENATIRKMWIGLIVLALLSPLGIILPDKFKAGSAWGEWGPDEIGKMAGYIPQGMKKVADIWSAPMPDYSFTGWDQMGLGMQSLAYIVSAGVGIGIIFIVTLLFGRLAARKEE
jgi:cobalt/nickel transport protein